ncbi:MAG: hypothetical protein WKF77_28870 [Planctomycetaceae bacterium]
MLFYSGFILLAGFLAIVAVGCLVAIGVRLSLAQTHVPRPGLWVAISVLFYAVAVFAGFRWLNRPSIEFERQFGFPPPPDVIHLSAQSTFFGDFGHRSMRFKANLPTVNRIIGRGMNMISNTEHCQHFSREYGADFSSETEELFYNPDTGEVTYEWTGVD